MFFLDYEDERITTYFSFSLENLGRISARLIKQGQRLVCELKAEDEEAREIIKENIENLYSTLSDSGFSVIIKT